MYKFSTLAVLVLAASTWTACGGNDFVAGEKTAGTAGAGSAGKDAGSAGEASGGADAGAAGKGVAGSSVGEGGSGGEGDTGSGGTSAGKGGSSGKGGSGGDTAGAGGETAGEGPGGSPATGGTSAGTGGKGGSGGGSGAGGSSAGAGAGGSNAGTGGSSAGTGGTGQCVPEGQAVCESLECGQKMDCDGTFYTCTDVPVNAGACSPYQRCIGATNKCARDCVRDKEASCGTSSQQRFSYRCDGYDDLGLTPEYKNADDNCDSVGGDHFCCVRNVDHCTVKHAANATDCGLVGPTPGSRPWLYTCKEGATGPSSGGIYNPSATQCTARGSGHPGEYCCASENLEQVGVNL